MRLRVLIVDDDALVARSLRRALEGEFEIVAVTGGRAALDALAAGQRFDAILCDVSMPDVSGLDLHDAVVARYPQLAGHTLFMTASQGSRAAREVAARVCEPLVAKPFDLEVLRARLRAVAAAPCSGASSRGA